LRESDFKSRARIEQAICVNLVNRFKHLLRVRPKHIGEIMLSEQPITFAAHAPVALAQLPQPFTIAGDQRLFLGSAPSFDLAFALDSFSLGRKGLGIDEGHGTAFEGISGAATVVVSAKAFLEVMSRTDVMGSVCAAKDIDVPWCRHDSVPRQSRDTIRPRS
jgi:hypothetical protein